MVVMPSMLVMGTLFGFTLGCIIHYLKVQPFIVTLMGAYFARGMAYIIDLNAVPIENGFYKALGLTPHRDSVPAQVVCVRLRPGRAHPAGGSRLPELLHALLGALSTLSATMNSRRC